MVNTPGSIDSVDVAMDLYNSQPLKASELSGKDIKRLERLKKKATEESGDSTKQAAAKVVIDRNQSDIAGIEQEFEILDRQNAFSKEPTMHERIAAERNMIEQEKKHQEAITPKKTLSDRMQYERVDNINR